jgi:hypothetical protein
VVTEECLLHPSRNPELGKEGIEKMLKDYLGLEKVIWLWKGMMGDDQVRPAARAPRAGPLSHFPRYAISASYMMRS